MLKGYAGKNLRINLTSGDKEPESLDEQVLKKFIGGSGYGIHLLTSEIKADIDPLSSENRLIFATGPLTLQGVPGGGSLEICFKSPLTFGWAESRVGCDFGFALKKAGYDFITVEGKAAEPVILHILDEKVELIAADPIKGMTISEKAEEIRNILDDDEEEYELLSIGPAGENLVPISSIMYGGRAAGRTGGGAVMGSKNLLAVAVKGTGRVDVADEDKFKELTKSITKKVRNHPERNGFTEHGTVGDLPSCDELGDWPTKNWRSNSWGKGEELYDYFYENNLVKNVGCYTGCPVACGRRAEVKGEKYSTPEHDGAEYESISAFTSFVLNEDMDAAVHSTYLCNEYGLDTISAGAAIAFILDCQEEGLISGPPYDDYDLSWGNAELLPKLVKEMADNKGLGRLLSRGVKEAADYIGPEAVPLAIHGKGLEAPAHDPRSGKALAVSYGTGSRGMCHIHPVEAMAYDSGKADFSLVPYGLKDPELVDRWDEKEKGKMVKLLQDGGTLPDILATCKFFMYVGVTIDDYADFLNAITGWNFSGDDLLEVGARAINLQRIFNVKAGMKPEDDQIPARMKAVPEFGQYSNQSDCAIKDYDMMLQEYYQKQGWDPDTGMPEAEVIQRLGLEDYAT